MRHIMVMNAKGGCGKSTLATNLASYYADAGYGVALADYDPQRSSLDWLDRRPDTRPKIAAVAGFEGRSVRDGRRRWRVVLVTPSSEHTASQNEERHQDQPTADEDPRQNCTDGNADDQADSHPNQHRGCAAGT